MKFSCEKALLQSAVSLASRTVSPKSTIPALEGILIRANADLQLTGYDLTTGIRTTIPAEVSEMGSIVLSARLFGDIVRRLPDDIVAITTEGLSVKIRCGRSVFNILGTSPEDYPELPPVESGRKMDMPRVLLHEMITQTLFSASTDESRPIHTGSLFDVNAAEGVLTMVSVDGYRLALRREKVKIENAEEDYKFVVPAPALSEVEKVCGDSEEPITITVGERHVMFHAENIIVVSRLLEGKFLDYKTAIPKDNGIKVTGETKDLQHTIERVSLIVTEKLKSPIRCQIGRDCFTARVSTALGDAVDECPLDGDGNDLEIGFNNRYILDALRAVPAETIRLSFSTPVGPCLLTPINESDEHFCYMILPVRLRSGN